MALLWLSQRIVYGSNTRRLPSRLTADRGGKANHKGNMVRCAILYKLFYKNITTLAFLVVLWQTDNIVLLICIPFLSSFWLLNVLFYSQALSFGLIWGGPISLRERVSGALQLGRDSSKQKFQAQSVSFFSFLLSDKSVAFIKTLFQ